MHGAVILSAGAGARLGGKCKAALRLPDGRSFLEVVIAAARAAGATRIACVVGPPHTAEAGRLAAGAELVHNPTPERGMLSSLVCGLDSLGEVDAALSWPVDHPFVRAETAAALLAAATRETIVLPVWRGRGGHPTVFGAATFGALRAAIDAPGGARAVIAAAGARVLRLAVEDPAVMRDVDLPEQLP